MKIAENVLVTMPTRKVKEMSRSTPPPKRKSASAASEGRRGRHDRAREHLLDRGIDDITQRAVRVELQFLADAVEDHDRLVDRVAGDAQDGSDHGRGELMAGEHKDADGHQDVVQRGEHRADAEAELEAEGDIDQDRGHRNAHREQGIELDLLADGGADMALTDLFQAVFRQGFLQCIEHNIPFALGGLDVERLPAAADGTDAGHVEIRDAVGLGDLANLRGIGLLLELHIDHIAAGEIDTVDLGPLVEHIAEADDDDRPGADERGFAVADEIDLNVLQQAVHPELFHEAGFDEKLHHEVRGDEHGKQRRKHADGERDAEALDRTGTQADHDAADDQLHGVRIENGPERLEVAALVGRREALAEGQLFTHAFENEDVRVHRHADGKHDAGEAG